MGVARRRRARRVAECQIDALSDDEVARLLGNSSGRRAPGQREFNPMSTICRNCRPRGTRAVLLERCGTERWSPRRRSPQLLTRRHARLRVAGRPVSATLAACVRAGIRVIGARHQQGATLMSIAFNYVAGGLRSAVIVSAGPAVTNTATGVLVAHDNRWPLLVIGGRRGVGTEPERAFQAFDGGRFLAPITKFAVAVAETGELAGQLAQAFSSAMHGAPGPVYVDAAEEALAGRVHQAALPSAESAAAGAHGPCTAAQPDATTTPHEPRGAAGAADRQAALVREWTRLRQLVDEHRFVRGCPDGARLHARRPPAV
jgi:hypothetical protein